MNPNPDHSDSLIQYMIRRLKDTSLFEVVSKAVKYIRRSFLVSRILRYTAVAVVILETSAILLAALTVFLVTVPAVAVVLLACFLYARRMTVALAEFLMRKGELLCLFLTDPTGEESVSPLPERSVLLLDPSLPSLFQPPKKRDGRFVVNSMFLFVIKKNRYPYQILNAESKSDNNDSKT